VCTPKQADKLYVSVKAEIAFEDSAGSQRSPIRGCQMVFFQTKNPNLGTFRKFLQLKMLVYFMPIWNILWPFAIFYGQWVILWYLGIFPPFWYIESRTIWQPWSNLFPRIHYRSHFTTKHVKQKFAIQGELLYEQHNNVHKNWLLITTEKAVKITA
jgi:hypothetical protein